jgi:hypothetical protein
MWILFFCNIHDFMRWICTFSQNMYLYIYKECMSIINLLTYKCARESRKCVNILYFAFLLWKKKLVICLPVYVFYWNRHGSLQNMWNFLVLLFFKSCIWKLNFYFPTFIYLLHHSVCWGVLSSRLYRKDHSGTLIDVNTLK